MSFDDRLFSAIDGIEVPLELSPENMKAMLDSMDIVQEPADNVPEVLISGKLEKMPARSRRLSVMRTVAAVAACVAVAGGAVVMNSNRGSIGTIESEKTYEAVQQVSSYDELYSIYSGIYNDHVLSREEIGDGEEIITNDPSAAPSQTTAAAVPGEAETAVSGTAPVTVGNPEESITDDTDDEPVRSDFSDADIVKSSGSFVYYLCGGTLYCVDKNDMSVTAEADSSYSPFEMDIYGDKLLLIGSDRDSGGDYVTAEIYDISGGVPVAQRSYRQNGNYVSTRTDERGYLMIVTSCSKVSGGNGVYPGIESYVPRYYIDGECFYIDASDVYVPQTASNVDYTVISTVPLNGSSVTVKAVLGGGANVYCTDDTLYVTGVDNTSSTDRTYITSFAVYEGVLEYKAQGVVDGALLSRHSMGVTGGYFRIACRSYDESGLTVTDVYTLDSSLNVVSSKKGLLKGQNDVKAKFEGSSAVLICGGEPFLSVDLDHEEEPDESTAETQTAPVINTTSVGSGLSMALTADGDVLTATLYGENGEVSGQYFVDDLEMPYSAAVNDSKALLVDEERMLVGFPVSGIKDGITVNRFCLFSTADGTLYTIGTAQFDGFDESFEFDRCVIDGNELILMGSGKIATVDLYTMTVKELIDF